MFTKSFSSEQNGTDGTTANDGLSATRFHFFCSSLSSFRSPCSSQASAQQLGADAQRCTCMQPPSLKKTMASRPFTFVSFALAVLLVNFNIAYGFSSPGAHVDGIRSRQCHSHSRCLPSYSSKSAPSIAACSTCRPVTSLFSYSSGDEEYVVGGEPPKKPPLALRAFRVFKRGMENVKRRGGTAALVVVSIALLALVYHFGRIMFSKVYALAHCYFTEVYRKSVTPPWEYEKTYGCLPPGANPETYGKILIKVDGKYYHKSGGPPDWPLKAGANLSAWSKRQLGIPVPIDWQRLTMLLSFLGGFLIYFIRNT